MNQTQQPAEPKCKHEAEAEQKLIKSPTLRILLIFCGWASLVLGVIGIFLPVLPTTPFLLLSAACFIRSSSKFYSWLMRHPVLGKYLGYYLSGKGLPRQAKIYTIVVLWAGISFSAWMVWPKASLLAILATCAVGVTAYLLWLPTAEINHEDDDLPRS